MSIQQLSFQAQLAQAAYAKLSAGMSRSLLEYALRAQYDGFTATQAQQFAAKYSVILQYNDDASILVGNGTSLSLAVFKDNTTNELTPAIRGTSDAADWPQVPSPSAYHQQLLASGRRARQRRRAVVCE